MQWLIAAGAVVLLAVMTGRSGELATVLKKTTGGGGGGGGVGASDAVLLPSLVPTPSYSGNQSIGGSTAQASVAPSYAATTPAPSPIALPPTTVYAPSGLPIGAGAGSGVAYVPQAVAQNLGLPTTNTSIVAARGGSAPGFRA